jgi:hypothetical protein
MVGDTMRLLLSPSKLQARCTKVLVIKTIRLKWSNLNAALNNNYDKGRLYNSKVYVYSSAYTSNPGAINKEYLLEDNAKPLEAAGGYSG